MIGLEDIIKKTEDAYLKQLIILLRTGKIEVAPAKKTTKEFLALSPFISVDDCKTKILPFTQQHPEFEETYIQLLKSIEDDQMHTVLSKMRSLLKDNKIDEALKMAK